MERTSSEERIFADCVRLRKWIKETSSLFHIQNIRIDAFLDGKVATVTLATNKVMSITSDDPVIDKKDG